jgi:branched-chain amino acid transport system substrate-binding protein
VIGEYGSLTGSTATFGISTRNGIDLAVGEVNAERGVLGRPVKVVVEDDAGKPEEAAAAVTKLVNQDRVVAVLGEVASTRSLAGARVCQPAGVPMVTPASTNPQVTEVGDFIFRTCFIDPFQGTVMAKFAREHLKVERVAILRDIKNDYSVGLADFFKKTFTELGGKIVGDESYSEGDTDFRAQLTNLKAPNPEALFIPGYYTEVGLIARQAREKGLTVPLMGGDGWDSPKLAEIAGEAIDGCFFSNHYTVESTEPRVQAFVSSYKAKYNEVPDAMAALGYDAAKILFQALETAGGTDPKAIRDALAATKDFTGVTGTITIDKDRNAVKPAVVLEMKGGKQTYVTTVEP